jgi:hypothetical protein
LIELGGCLIRVRRWLDFLNEFGGFIIIGRRLDLLIELEGCLIGVRRCLDFFNEFGGLIIIWRWIC